MFVYMSINIKSCVMRTLHQISLFKSGPRSCCGLKTQWIWVTEYSTVTINKEARRLRSRELKQKWTMEDDEVSLHESIQIEKYIKGF